MSVKKFFSSIGNWFNNFNTKKNWAAVEKVVIDASEVATAVVTKNMANGIVASTQLARDAQTVELVVSTTSVLSPTSSTPVTTYFKTAAKEVK